MEIEHSLTHASQVTHCALDQATAVGGPATVCSVVNVMCVVVFMLVLVLSGACELTETMTSFEPHLHLWKRALQLVEHRPAIGITVSSHPPCSHLACSGLQPSCRAYVFLPSLHCTSQCLRQDHRTHAHPHAHPHVADHFPLHSTYDDMPPKRPRAAAAMPSCTAPVRSVSLVQDTMLWEAAPRTPSSLRRRTQSH